MRAQGAHDCTVTQASDTLRESVATAATSRDDEEGLIDDTPHCHQAG